GEVRLSHISDMRTCVRIRVDGEQLDVGVYFEAG
ncbi:MAG: hypothetical protein RL398_1261, partial [Planctomycetota bacterium]